MSMNILKDISIYMLIEKHINIYYINVRGTFRILPDLFSSVLFALITFSEWYPYEK